MLSYKICRATLCYPGRSLIQGCQTAFYKRSPSWYNSYVRLSNRGLRRALRTCTVLSTALRDSTMYPDASVQMCLSTLSALAVLAVGRAESDQHSQHSGSS